MWLTRSLVVGSNLHRCRGLPTTPPTVSDIETQLQQRPTIQVVSSLQVEVIDGPDRGAAITGGDTISIGTAKDNGCPVIEDDVVIGCGARVLGPIRIGRGAFIGANSVVLTDVPAGAVVSGIPAKIHRRGEQAVDAQTDAGGTPSKDTN